MKSKIFFLVGAIFLGNLFFVQPVEKVFAATSQQTKYTPPPARYAPPQIPDYGLPQPAYTPPPPPEPKRK